MKIGVITTSRADFGIYLPLLEKIREHKDLELILYAGGSHVEESLGHTIGEIFEKGFDPVQLPSAFGHDYRPGGISNNMGNSLLAMSSVFQKSPADFVICLGDRYEMISSVLALIPFNIPLAHIHGGEETEGAIDNKFRHALTQLCNFHFVSCEAHLNRVKTMGFSSNEAFNVGALSLDKINSFNRMDDGSFYQSIGLTQKTPFAIATFHPTTTETFEKNKDDINHFIEAIQNSKYNYLITLPNSDTYGDYYKEKLLELGKKNPNKFFVVESLGSERYFNALEKSLFMIGNSSSGLIEAASFNLPVINIGNRQKGRMSSNNVINCTESSLAITKTIDKIHLMMGKKFTNIFRNEKRSASDAIMHFLLEQRAIKTRLHDQKSYSF